jgi:hypothetical protein
MKSVEYNAPAQMFLCHYATPLQQFLLFLTRLHNCWIRRFVHSTDTVN